VCIIFLVTRKSKSAELNSIKKKEQDYTWVIKHWVEDWV